MQVARSLPQIESNDLLLPFSFIFQYRCKFDYADTWKEKNFIIETFERRHPPDPFYKGGDEIARSRPRTKPLRILVNQYPLSSTLRSDAILGQFRPSYNEFTLEGVLGATAASHVILHRPYHIIGNHKNHVYNCVCQGSCDGPGQFDSTTYYEAHFRLYATTCSFCLKPLKVSLCSARQDALMSMNVGLPWSPLDLVSDVASGWPSNMTLRVTRASFGSFRLGKHGEFEMLC